jgi:hypothetical protein
MGRVNREASSRLVGLKDILNPVPHMSGLRDGLNGSTQHWLDVYFEESKKLKSFASVDSNGNTTLSRVLNEYSWTDRFSRGTIVVSPD